MYDLTKLSRDYQKQPLKKGEWPNEADVRYLYIECNMPELELRKFFNRSRRIIKQWIVKWKLIKNKDAISAIRKKTIKDRYGVDSLYQHPQYREKLQSTFRDKYGTNSPFENPQIREKARIEYNKFLNNEEKFNQWKNNRLKTNIYRYDSWNTQKHLSKETIKILSSKEELSNYINSLPEKDRTVHIISDNLKVHFTTINHKLQKYDLKHLVKLFAINESTQHREIKALLEDLQIEYCNNDRNVLNGKEIDLFCEKYKLGIEFNGNYWHRVVNKGKKYHQNKSILAESKNLFLYHIFEEDWANRRPIVISQLKNLLKKNDEIVFARKCEIKEVSNVEAKHFLEANHLQGNCSSIIRIGLYYQGELISLMTFGKSRFNKKYQWELLRFCCKLNTSVVGGASKLFKYFLREYNPTNIISYSDIAHTKGTMYKILDFKLVRITNPNYVWVKREETLTRYQCQKHKLVKKYPQYKDLTETEIMNILGYEKLEDSGNKVWLWTKNKYT